MKPVAIIYLTALPFLAGCDRGPDASGGSDQHGRGRYSGIGIYETGRLWSQIKVDPATLPAVGNAR